MTTSADPDRAPDHPHDERLDAERGRLGKEASFLLVLLSEEPDDPGINARLDAWRTESPLHKEVWERTCRAYRMIGGSPAIHRESWDRSVAPVDQPAPDRAAVRTPRFGLARIAIAGTVVALAAVLGIVAAPQMLVGLQADVTTTTAEIRPLDLEDGSRMLLGPRSAVDIAYFAGERRVRLLQGEAFFEVTPNADRPFRVIAGDVVATVLGTAFEVALRGDGAAVGVRSGHVRVEDTTRSPPVSENLTAGDCIRVAAHAVRERRAAALQDIGAWRTGQFVAHDRPISDVVDRLRGYYGGVIVVQDSEFVGRVVTGVYDLQDPETTLRNLAAAYGATVRGISPWVLLVTSR